MITGTETVVLFGGASGERRVSVASAQHVLSLLEGARGWFVAPDGAVYDYPRAELLRHERVFETDLPVPARADFASLASALDAASKTGGDRVFFLGFHGGAGEDGTVQRELEARGLAFTGSGSVASARAFDKNVAKEFARNAGVRTAEAIAVGAGDERAIRDALLGLLARHGRAVLKPVADGSSVGLHHVRNADEATQAAQTAAADRERAYLAEAFVAGRELTVGVVQDARGARALPPSEVRLDPGRAFDFEGKYLGRGTVEITPAEVSSEITRAAHALALAVHTAVGCEGYSRTDMIVDEKGPVFLEINTLPGLTRASFLPQQLAAEGTSVRAFLDAQVALARARRDAALSARGPRT